MSLIITSDYNDVHTAVMVKMGGAEMWLQLCHLFRSVFLKTVGPRGSSQSPFESSNSGCETLGVKVSLPLQVLCDGVLYGEKIKYQNAISVKFFVVVVYVLPGRLKGFSSSILRVHLPKEGRGPSSFDKTSGLYPSTSGTVCRCVCLEQFE